MAGLKKRRRIQLVMVGGILLTIATGLVIYAGRDAFEFFRSPSDIAEDPPRPGERFRLGGLVTEDTWARGQTHFSVGSDTAMDYPVRYEVIMPDLFREGQGTVVTGQIEDGVFVASEVLAKHDETYLPSEVVDALKEQGVYREDTGGL